MERSRLTRHNRREFLKTLGRGAAGLMMGSTILSASRCASSENQPNILLIMADDMGYSDLGCYGSDIHTPNIDRLAAEGIRFSHFYNAARCCPTRASLLTGLYPHQAGMGGMIKRDLASSTPGPYQGYLNNHCVTIAEVLRDAGYATYMSGKWHVGEFKPHWPTNRGFDRYFGLISGAANYFDIKKGKKEGIVRYMSLDGTPWTPPESGFYMTNAIADHAVTCIKEHYERGDGQPFFQYLAFTAPHWPLHALPEDIEKYRGKFLDGWDSMRERRYKRLVDMGIIKKSWALSPLDDDVTPWEKVPNKEAMAEKMAVYAAQIDCMDQGIGRVLEVIQKQGQLDNTLVLFLSDNGGCHEGGPWGFDNRKNGLPPGGVDSYMSYGRSWANASNTPFRMFKHWVHEGGISTPLIARWPQVIKHAGSITHEVGHIVDIMATCCDVARATYPEHKHGNPITPAEGISLLPILKGRSRMGHDILCWEHEKNRAIRKGNWKLVSKDRGEWELYNLDRDRTELNNLIGSNPRKAAELKADYEAWAKRIGV